MKKASFWETTRPLGLIVLVLAILVYVSGAPSGLLFFAAAILLLTPAQFGHQLIASLQNSVKKMKILFEIALYDALFWLVVFLGGFALLNVIKQAGTALQGLPLQQPAVMVPEIMATNTAALQGFVGTAIIGITLLALLSWIAYTGSRYLIWKTIMSKKFDKKSLRQFVALSAIIWAIWLPILAALVFMSSQQPPLRILVFVWMLVLAYFTPLFFVLFMRTNKVKYSITHGIAYGIGNAHRLLAAYAIIFVIYVVAYQLMRLASQLPSRALQVISVLFVILFTAWIRLFLTPIIEKFED